jgi:voltage-gated potassium channel Kch
MSDTPEIPAYHKRSRRVWFGLLFAAVIALIFGTAGYMDYDAKELAQQNVPIDHSAGSVIHRWWSAFYETLQLFFFHTPHFNPPPGFCLELARSLAAIVTLWAVGGVLWRVYKMLYRHDHYSRIRDHIVICGAGWRGLALAGDYSKAAPGAKPGTEKKPEIIVLERDPDSPGIQECERLGIPYLIGDASDPKLLQSVNAHQARTLIASCGNDDANLEIAIRVGDLARESRSSEKMLKCYVHLANDDLRTMLRQKGVARCTGKVDISTFGTDIEENTARALFEEHLLDREAITSSMRVHLIIMGYEETGEAVLAQAIRIGQFANVEKEKLKVTVACPNAEAKESAFRKRCPAIAQVAEVEFLDRQPHDPALVSLLALASKETNHLTTCVICFPDEKLNLALAVKLGDAVKDRSIPILWWLRSCSRSGVGLLLSQELQPEPFGENVKPFGMLEKVFTLKSLEQEQLDDMARNIHDFYVKEQKLKGDNPEINSSLQPWESLSENIKHSNRLAADHIKIKLRAIGYHMVKWTPESTLTVFSEAQIEILARMEHARFCAERFMDGWQWADGEKDAALKTNPTLVPWDKLPLSEKEKDVEQVEKIPRILKDAGWALSR